jgi:hypothetical protein
LGVHLPLSTNLPETDFRGTRHAAALGLAERCDAMVMVVSEESGTLSVAHHGRLRQIAASDLTIWIKDHYRDRSDAVRKPFRYRETMHSVGRKLAALVMACILWVLFASRVETIQRTFIVPIEYRNLPETWVIDDPRPTRAELTLSGSERAFDMLDVSNLAISLDLEHLRSAKAHTLRTQEHLKDLPAELKVHQIRPAVVTITARRSDR